MNITKEANIAAKWILDGKVIAYPTEGVWGIGGLDLTKNIEAINSAKERMRTKNAINRVAISAKVAIHAGAPTGGHLGHSSSSSSTSCASSSAMNLSRLCCDAITGVGQGA